MTSFLSDSLPHHKKRLLLTITLFCVIGITVSLLSIFLLRDVFDLTSSNSTLYFVKEGNRAVTIKRDLFTEDESKLIFKIDFNKLIRTFIRGEAVARGRALLDVTWDTDTGRGEIKQFRPNGTMLSVTFSRFREEGNEASGLFIGGDLPFGDPDRSAEGATYGMAYYDGKDWYHIWCAANEGFALMPDVTKFYAPHEWKYLNSRILKKTDDEVLLESSHLLDNNRGNIVQMTRQVHMRAADEFLTLNVEFMNKSNIPVEFIYVYGDDPWIGNFGNSLGDVGWTETGIVKHETFISPLANQYAGFWDYGNDAAGEKHNYTGMANFIKWISPLPSHVYFSNSFANCCLNDTPIASYFNRIINVMWSDWVLLPGQTTAFTLLIGKANINAQTGMPDIPEGLKH